MHANKLSAVRSSVDLPKEPPTADMFSPTQKDPSVLSFREAVFDVVRNNVDHGRGTAIVLSERLIRRVRKIYGSHHVSWLPLNGEDVQPWEEAVQVVLTDIANGDYEGAANAYDYLVASSKDFIGVALLVANLTSANYFLKNVENSPESA